MRRRACAAALLCGLLVAGCGSVRPLDSSGQTRPATPLTVSVALAGGRPLVDPRRVRPGAVLFQIANQTDRAETVSIVLPDGRTVARSVVVPAGGTGQIQTALTRTAYGVELDGQPRSMTLVSVRGRARSGDDQLAQP